jgi:hypothetical protein
MKSWKKWLLLTGVFYLFFLAWHLPARLCWQWAAPHLGTAAARVKVAGISGAWSEGRLASLESGSLRLNDLTWSFRPLGLLAGQLRFALAAKLLGEAPVSTTLTLTPKRQGLLNLRGRVPADLLGEALLPGLGLSGNLNAQDLDLYLKQGHLTSASGSLSWQDAGVSFPDPAALGNLSLQLATESGIIAATLKDQGGPLSINVLARLKPGGTYELTGALLPRGQLKPELASLVRLFGKPAADGRVLLRSNGRLAAIF